MKNKSLDSKPNSGQNFFKKSENCFLASFIPIQNVTNELKLTHVTTIKNKFHTFQSLWYHFMHATTIKRSQKHPHTFYELMMLFIEPCTKQISIFLHFFFLTIFLITKTYRCGLTLILPRSFSNVEQFHHIPHGNVICSRYKKKTQILYYYYYVVFYSKERVMCAWICK